MSVTTPTAVVADSELPAMMDLPGYRHLPGNNRSRVVVCDHASNRIPEELGDLGLAAAERQRHIAWDPGAAGVAESLATRLSAPLFLHGWSRLIADPNRQFESNELIPEVSDGIIVPGNQNLSEAQRHMRFERFHQPYHQAIASHLDACIEDAVRPLFISVHSFSPEVGGKSRPWQTGVLWDEDAETAQQLIGALRDRGLMVGDNQPYSGRDQFGYSIEVHAAPRGLRHTLIEIRQDLLLTAEDQHWWAELLARCLSGTAATPAF